MKKGILNPPKVKRVCEEFNQLKWVQSHLVGTGGQPTDFYGCDDCADDKRDGTV